MESWILVCFSCRMLLAVPTRTSYLQYNQGFFRKMLGTRYGSVWAPDLKF